MKKISLEDMTLKNAIRLMMEETTFTTFKEVAENTGMSKSTFQSAMDRDNLKVRDLQKILDALGYEIKFEKKEERESN